MTVRALLLAAARWFAPIPDDPPMTPAYRAGRRAWEDGERIGYCPHPQGSPARNDWRKGWREGESIDLMTW